MHDQLIGNQTGSYFTDTGIHYNNDTVDLDYCLPSCFVNVLFSVYRTYHYGSSKVVKGRELGQLAVRVMYIN